MTMNKAKRNKFAATEALKMANRTGSKVAIAVDDDERAENMLRLVERASKQLGLELGETIKGNGVLTVPVGEGEVRIVSADRLGPQPVMN